MELYELDQQDHTSQDGASGEDPFIPISSFHRAHVTESSMNFNSTT